MRAVALLALPRANAGEGFLDELRGMLTSMKRKLDQTRPLSRTEIEDAWAKEVERRVTGFDRGEMESYPAEDVFVEARHLCLKLNPKKG